MNELKFNVVQSIGEITANFAKYCSEHVGDYFALCEKRWMVKQ